MFLGKVSYVGNERKMRKLGEKREILIESKGM